MSSQTDSGPPNAAQVQDLSVTAVQANPRNPRLVFPEEELDRLAESIHQEGILVPIVVYPEDDGKYTLIDGERRFRCALRLGLESVPALITDRKGDIENLVSMFNIHQMREPWRDMPTAIALRELEDAMKADGAATPSDRALADRTGLSQERVKRLRYAVQLPDEYQHYIQEGTIPLNWFWELHRNVIQPLANKRPKLHEEFGEDAVRSAFVAKRLGGTITDTVSLRDVRPIINYAGKDAEASDSDDSVLDDTLRRLLQDPDLTIATAYEDTVQIMVEADKLDRSTENMIKGFDRLFARATGNEERAMVMGIAERFAQQLKRVIAENAGGE
ncbi:MAG: ParB/RepB/Spo0J family partition protein [Acidimicrobiaceae bacterium]|nr:ParB/RepB/Spo0J family partition protein [Acidimicrobiia bacterium]MCY4494305.1 ParB/RepB/Spo0J family partition protein [Acidimicrobiaceae bacterium]